MEPLLTVGALRVTPYSLMVFAGALAGALLAARKKAARPALPWVALLALLFSHVVWCLLNDTAMEYYGFSLLFQPWRGGYTLYGALAGGAVGAAIAAALTRQSWLELLDALAPGAAAALFFARLGEYFSGQGVGPTVESEALCFFPLTFLPFGETPETGDWVYAVWFWEAVTALVLLAVLLLRRNRRRGDPTFLFLSVLGLTQIFFEQIRRDDYVSLTGFVRFSQVGALVSILAVMIALTVMRRPRPLRAVLSFAVLVCAGLTVMYVEFALDKTRYFPFLYAATAATAAAAAALLLAARGRQGRMSAGMTALAGGILLFSHGLEAPTTDIYIILYGFMAWALACIGIAVAICMQPQPKEGTPVCMQPQPKEGSL